MRMDNPNKCSNHNSLANVFATSVMITLLTFGALTIDPLLVVIITDAEISDIKAISIVCCAL